MKTYIIKRFLLMIPTLVGVSIIIYIIMAIIPGDVAIAILGNQATKRAADELREELGLNDPHHEQYFRWVKNMVTIDMGVSLFNTKRPIKDLVIQYFPVTFNLAIYAMVLSLVMGIGMGVLSAIKHDTWVDYVVRSIAILGLAIPNFWLAILIMLVLAWGWGWQADWIYVTPWENPWANISSLFWPTVTVALFLVSFIARMTRSQLMEVLLEDYMRTARAKGLRERVVVIRHGMKNAIIPIVSLTGLMVLILLGGLVVTEKVYNLAGWGTLLWNGVFMRDLPLVQTMIFLFASIVVVVNLLTDITYAWLDPRIRYG
jgi:peptide/nickel transport system permease protein